MTLDAREDFLGPSRVTAAARRNGWLSALVIVPFGLFMSLMWLGDPPQVTAMHTFVFILSPLIGLAIIVYGIRGAVQNFRQASAAEPDGVWYTLTDAGLTLPDSVEYDRSVPWSGMLKLEDIGGSPPELKLTCRPEGAKIDRSFRLRADLRNKDGATFGDRMRVWFDGKVAGSASRPPAASGT